MSIIDILTGKCNVVTPTFEYLEIKNTTEENSIFSVEINSKHTMVILVINVVKTTIHHTSLHEQIFVY